jgi:hypothetical protein
LKLLEKATAKEAAANLSLLGDTISNINKTESIVASTVAAVSQDKQTLAEATKV